MRISSPPLLTYAGSREETTCGPPLLSVPMCELEMGCQSIVSPFRSSAPAPRTKKNCPQFCVAVTILSFPPCVTTLSLFLAPHRARNIINSFFFFLNFAHFPQYVPVEAHAGSPLFGLCVIADRLVLWSRSLSSRQAVETQLKKNARSTRPSQSNSLLKTDGIARLYMRAVP